ncbi:hypothetical protein B0T16DRAFT_515272 [Cercophora newfieldiana]|uniref:DSBA-like thioredoxin domain-containing protein n=1 Tax=Cercophora newfieldiana TaxID=92897 RepID=A0AA40CJX2_9PEZI|nr:hypothetical protein B0T16DRAFT_515272 [Cercophora newfieldiana]
MAKFKVDIYADTVCPWCYINKKSIDAAIAKHQTLYPEDEFDLVWRPYLLYPNAKVSAYNKKDSFLLKFGPDAPTILERVQRVGAPYGVNFTWEGRTGSSRDSHKLILLAADQDASSSFSTTTTTATSTSSSPSTLPLPENDPSPPPGPCARPLPPSVLDPRPETTPSHPHPLATPSPRNPLLSKQNSLTEALLSGALSHNQDISSRSFLIPVALAHGLAASEEEIVRYLDSEEANARVDAETARARGEIGVAAVPSVVVNGRYRVGGMQEPGVFLGLFERLRGR